ncbi:hypothetical protein P4S24_004484, partial [Providencia stuartii]
NIQIRASSANSFRCANNIALLLHKSPPDRGFFSKIKQDKGLIVLFISIKRSFKGVLYPIRDTFRLFTKNNDDFNLKTICKII